MKSTLKIGQAEAVKAGGGTPRRVGLAVASLLAAGLALRLYDLNAGLWVDEIQTLVSYARQPFGEIVTTYGGENQHLLFTILAHASIVIFGESAWALRLPAVVFGVGSLGAVYLLGREVASPREAFLSAALLTFSYQHVWFSQDARGYTGLLFWTLLSTWFLLRGLREARPHAWWLAYALSAALGVYTQLVMVFVIAGHFVIYLSDIFVRRQADRPNRWTGLWFGFCPGGCLTLLLHALVLPQMLTNIGTDPSVVEEWKTPAWTLLELARGLRVGFAGWFAAAAAVGVFCAGLWSLARTKPAVLLLLFVSPALLTITVVAAGHHLWPRFYFHLIGFGVLVVVRGTLQLAAWIARPLRLPPDNSLGLGTLLCSGLIGASALSAPLAYGPKQDYNEARAFVEARQQPGDRILTVGPASWVYKNFYHLAWENVSTLDQLNTARAQTSRTWVIYTFPTVVQSKFPEVMESLQRDFVVVQEFNGTVGDGTIFVCLPKTSAHGDGEPLGR